jgi:hypothetical protein
MVILASDRGMTMLSKRTRPLSVSVLTAATMALGACDAAPLDPSGGPIVGTAPPPAAVASSLSTMASFRKGLVADLAAVLPSDRLGPSGEPRVDGVQVVYGYGVDLALLGTEFSVGRGVGGTAPTADDPMLSFGGWVSSTPAERGPKARRAAQQLWEALAGVPGVSNDGRTRQTPGGRAICTVNDNGETREAHCAFTGFLGVDTAETPCP